MCVCVFQTQTIILAFFFSFLLQIKNACICPEASLYITLLKRKGGSHAPLTSQMDGICKSEPTPHPPPPFPNPAFCLGEAIRRGVCLYAYGISLASCDGSINAELVHPKKKKHFRFFHFLYFFLSAFRKIVCKRGKACFSILPCLVKISKNIFVIFHTRLFTSTYIHTYIHTYRH